MFLPYSRLLSLHAQGKTGISWHLVQGFRMKLIHLQALINQRVFQPTEKNLKKRKIKLPEIAFNENMPNFVTDITLWSDEILKDYGFTN